MADNTTEETLVLARADVAELLTWEDVLEAVESTFVAIARGDARPFPTVREPIATGMIGIRGGNWPARALGTKVSGFIPANREVGLDSHQAVVVLLDEHTGRPRALVDGNEVTWLRTALAGAAGTRALARADARTVVVVGNGLQAEAQIRSHSWLLAERRPRFLVHAPRDDDGQKAAAFCARLREHGVTVEPAPHLEDALGDADVVITATPATRPFVPAGAIRPGTHVTAMGADAPGKRELDDELVAFARFVADDRTQSRLFGEGQGLSEEAAAAVVTLGEVLAGAGGDRRPDQITIFDSTGLGLHDVATAALAVERALERGVGTSVRF